MQLLVIQKYPLEQAEDPANTLENNKLLVTTKILSTSQGVYYTYKSPTR